MSESSEDVHPLELETVVASSWSTDGEAFAIQCTDDIGEAVLIKMPAGQFDSFFRAVHNLKEHRDRAGRGKSEMVLRKPRQFSVAHSNETPAHLAIIFDQGTPIEAAFLIPDAQAMMLVDRIMKDLHSRNDDATRAHRMMAPKIILPPGFQKQ